MCSLTETRLLCRGERGTGGGKDDGPGQTWCSLRTRTYSCGSEYRNEVGVGDVYRQGSDRHPHVCDNRIGQDSVCPGPFSDRTRPSVYHW